MQNSTQANSFTYLIIYRIKSWCGIDKKWKLKYPIKCPFQLHHRHSKLSLLCSCFHVSTWFYHKAKKCLHRVMVLGNASLQIMGKFLTIKASGGLEPCRGFTNKPLTHPVTKRMSMIHPCSSYKQLLFWKIPDVSNQGLAFCWLT